MRRFYRPRANRMLGGVCAGLANYFNINPTIVRIIFVLLALPGGAPGVLPYGLLWLLMPDEGRTM